MLFSRIALLSMFFSFVSTASESFSDHESFCFENSSKECLELILKKKDSAPLYSKQWYKLVSYELDYYYDKREFAQLEAALSPLFVIEDKPDVFEMQLNYYYSKTLVYFGENDKAKIYAYKAIKKLKAIYNEFEDPMRMIEIANLEYVFGDKKNAYKLLLLAENKFGDRTDPIFHTELNTNKGHIFYSWKNYDIAAKFYKVAFEWISSTKHDAKTVIATSNLARVYQLMKSYDLALKYFKKTEMLLSDQSNPKLLSIILIRTAEVYEELNELDKVSLYLKRINILKLNKGYHTTYHRLMDKIKD